MPRACIIIFILAVAMGISSGYAYEVYHWVDENGVPHYSQERPDENIAGVRKLQLEDTTPPDYDPEEDRYGVEEQAERMAGLREDRQARRDEARERQLNAPQPPVVIYQEPYYPGYLNRLWLPPAYPWPPVRPEPPIAVPYRTATLASPRG